MAFCFVHLFGIFLMQFLSILFECIVFGVWFFFGCVFFWVWFFWCMLFGSMFFWELFVWSMFLGALFFWKGAFFW